MTAPDDFADGPAEDLSDDRADEVLDAADAATDEVPLDVPEDDVAEQRRAVLGTADGEGVDADERAVELDEDEYR